jgi:hypothetical protein
MQQARCFKFFLDGRRMIWKRSGHWSDALDKPASLQTQIDCKLLPMPKADISQPVFAANLNHNRDAGSKMEKNQVPVLVPVGLVI